MVRRVRIVQFDHQTCFKQPALVRCSLTCVDLAHFTRVVLIRNSRLSTQQKIKINVRPRTRPATIFIAVMSGSDSSARLPSWCYGWVNHLVKGPARESSPDMVPVGFRHSIGSRQSQRRIPIYARCPPILPRKSLGYSLVPPRPASNLF